ncbi:hypothetical protein ACNPN6_06695 [Enterobacter quasiroggenkampii]|uniref:RipA family octameric membrane protein n=1 Tax=Enterobacter quasiroggenkampii TaxID=2497436 RepID=UPI003AAB50A3
MTFFRTTRNYLDGISRQPHQANLTQDDDSDEKSFRQNHFKSNIFYFKKLLGMRLYRRDYLIDSDLAILKEAYDKAHQKVQFEIDLHWRRTTHVWTLILALLVATGAILTQYFTAKDIGRDFWTVVVLISSIICIIVSHTALSLLKISHMWCRNWELHVVMLEPFFSGLLYQTHLGVGRKRFSMSKLNNIFIWIALSGWIAIYELSIFKLSSSVLNFILSTITIFSLIHLSGWIIGKSIESPDNYIKEYELSSYGIKPIPLKGRIDKSLDNAKSIGVSLLYGIGIFSLIFLSAFIIIHYIEGIELRWDMFKQFLKSDLRNLFAFPVISK